jgi:predicted nucleotidyltransferase
MALRDELHRRRDDILTIAARHGASNLRLFGSVARSEERADSDIDLLVDLAEDLALIEELESLFGRRVEVVIARSLSRHFRPYVEAEALSL